MPRVTHVKKARKDYPDHGIKKGNEYYHWAFMSGGRGGPKHYSKTPPKPSQLTQSEFWGNVYSIQEANSDVPDFDDIESQIESIKSELEEGRDNQQERLDNLPDGLRDGPTGGLLQERYDALDECISTLDSIDTSIDLDGFGEESDEAVDAKRDRAEEIWSEVTDALSNISCS